MPSGGGATTHSAAWAGSITAGGSTGGTANDALEKSKNSNIALAAASRRVSGGNPQRVSMNFRIDVWSLTTWETECGLLYGEMTATGTRNPYRSKAPGMSPGWSIGGMSSGG